MKNLLFLIVIFITNVIQAITGFAGTLLAMPPSMILIGVDEAKVVLNLIALITCVFISIKNKEFISFKILKKIIVYMGLGMIAGIVIFQIVDLKILLYLYGVVIVAIALKSLFVKNEIKLTKLMVVILLLVAGIIHGMFISGGALLVVYVAHELKDKNQFRATMAFVWVLLDTVMLITQGCSGLLNKNLLLITAISLIPALLGVYFGNKIHNKISKDMFMKATYVLLLISGITIFI